MEKVQLVLENLINKIFAREILIKVIKFAVLLIYIMWIINSFEVGFLFYSLFFCFLYVFLYEVNKILKEDEEYRQNKKLWLTLSLEER